MHFQADAQNADSIEENNQRRQEPRKAPQPPNRSVAIPSAFGAVRRAHRELRDCTALGTFHLWHGWIVTQIFRSIDSAGQPSTSPTFQGAIKTKVGYLRLCVNGALLRVLEQLSDAQIVFFDEAANQLQKHVTVEQQQLSFRRIAGNSELVEEHGKLCLYLVDLLRNHSEC